MKFEEVFITPDPTGPRGKSVILAQLGAHCLVDDKPCILSEASRTGAHTVRAYPSKDLNWFPQLIDWVKHKGVDWILRKHRAAALRRDQYSQARESSWW